MTLAELQRDITAVCLDLDPDAERLQRLGNARRFHDYRRMVRQRIHEELRRSFKRTCSVVGAERFDRMIDQYLANHGPRSRFFHYIPVEFAAHMLPYLRETTAIPTHAADLMQLEATRREVANLLDLPHTERQGLLPFDFEQHVVLHPTVRLLALHHPVHEAADEGCDYPQQPTFLALYRPTDDARVRHFVVNPVTFDLLRLLVERPYSMKDAVAQVSQTRHIRVDAPFLDGLCEVLSGFIEGKLVLGCKAHKKGA